MNRDQPTTAARVATGAAVGLLAGLVASLAMDRFQALTQPSSAEEGEPATQQAADRIARDVTGEPLSDDAKPFGGQAVHYGLGAALGVAYGVTAEFFPAVTAGAGTAFAGTSWALLDEAAVPAAGLGDPPWKSPPATQAYSLASHVVFGVTAELTRRLVRGALAGGPRRKPNPSRQRWPPLESPGAGEQRHQLGDRMPFDVPHQVVSHRLS